MSAYVVGDDCINAIVTWLAGPRRDWERGRVEEALDKTGKFGDTFEQQLGNAMFKANCDAVNARYGENQAQEFRPLDYNYKPVHLGSNYAVYDRIGEWHYQCSEGDVPETSLIFKAIENIYNSMGHNFFRRLRDDKDEERGELRRRLEKLEALLPKHKAA